MATARLQAVGRGKNIFVEGSKANEVFLIKSGRVEIYHKGSDGGKVVLKTIGANEIFGEMALIDGQPRSASATALEDTEFYALNRAEFEKKLDEADIFIRAIYRVLSNTVREMNQKLIQASKKS